jgi:hypothetical protein
MSRITIYQDARLLAVGGQDHMLGQFLQVFDKNLENETPEGEGLVYDWSQGFGTETDLTGLSKDLEPLQKVLQYIEENKYVDKEI